MDLAEQALEMVQHSLQQRRQQAAVQVPAVMTSQVYQKNVMPSIVSITGKFETTSQSWFGQTQNSESEVLVQVSSLARKMVRF